MSEILLPNGTPVPFPEVARYYSPRPAGEAVCLIVLHHSAGRAAVDLPILLGKTERQVSAHFYIDKCGAVRQLVRLEDAAWHAGESCWQGRTGCNAFSIGIEQENLGHEPWPDAQIHACAALCRALMAKYHLPAAQIVAHKDIACWIEHGQVVWTKNGGRRKIDPAGYPWEKFHSYLS